jgi:hypothetical protein
MKTNGQLNRVSYPKKTFKVPELSPASVGEHVPIAMPSPLFDSFAETLIEMCDKPELNIQMYDLSENGRFERAGVYTTYWLPPNDRQHCVIEVRREGAGADYYQIGYTDVVPLVRHFIEQSNEGNIGPRFVITELYNSQFREWLESHGICSLYNDAVVQLLENDTSAMGERAEDLYSTACDD